MKRKDFLRKMRNRRRGDQLELRESDRRRASDWRTLRVDLPAADASPGEHDLPVGKVTLLPTGIRLQATGPCWVRGYRVWTEDDGHSRAEFQYRPVDEPGTPPPGATAVDDGATWEPSG